MAEPSTQTGWRRIVVRAISMLLCGAALNVAVAWALPWAASYWYQGLTPPTVKEMNAPLSTLGIPLGVPLPDRSHRTEYPFSTHWQIMWDGLPGNANVEQIRNRPIVAYLTHWGWPMRSLQIQTMRKMCEYGRTTVPLVPSHFPEWRTGVDIGSKRYPLFPVWPGFAINTLFYAAIVASICLGLTRLRAARRNRAGRCPACGYDRRGLADGTPCPECGQGRE
ncbi:MAG: hypothetical protein ACKVZJ_11365 [Phycisphaerales bacterium]